MIQKNCDFIQSTCGSIREQPKKWARGAKKEGRRVDYSRRRRYLCRAGLVGQAMKKDGKTLEQQLY